MVGDLVVGVAGELTPVRRALERRGYRVVALEEAIGLDDDLLALVVSEAGVGEEALTAPVIPSRGRTPEQVAEAIEATARRDAPLPHEG